MRRSIIFAAVAAVLAHLPLPAAAQSQDYFIPGQAKPAPAPAHPVPRPAQRPAPGTQVAPPPAQIGVGGIGGDAQEQEPPPLNAPLPPPVDLPPLPKGEAPPAAVIGVIGVPEVMRASVAAQQVEKVIGERRAKLNDDAQKEQATWRDMQQALANDRAKLSPEQLRTRERELQERITNAQRQFRERNRIIQEAAQYALAQIERTLISVIKQVSEARGMNLVLHRSQVALNVNQFDITDQVTAQLNKMQAGVVIPPDGMSPMAEAPVVKGQPSQASAPAAATPASAPPATPAVPSK